MRPSWIENTREFVNNKLKQKPVIKLLLLGTGFFICRNIYHLLYRKIYNYPPGPIGIPIFGSVFPFVTNPRKFLVYIANKYGAITFASLIASKNIFISDLEILKKLYQEEKIISRPPFHTRPVDVFSQINGKEWRIRRKYAMVTITTLNTSFVLSNAKYCLKKYILPILDEKYIKQNKLWYPEEFMHFISFNNVFSAVFGVTLPFNDPFIDKYCEYGKKSIERLQIIILIDLITNYSKILQPQFIKKIISFNIEQYGDEILIKWMKSNGFIVDMQRNILQKMDSDKTCDIYIDFLIQKLQCKEITIAKVIGDIHLLLNNAIDTTSKALEYGFLLLAKYPIIQRLIYEELMNVMKKHNLKEFDFTILNELHIFRAFIHEVLRIACIAPLGVPHMTVKNHTLEVNGKKMFIPKDTVTHSNSYYMLKYLDWNNNEVLKEENNSIHLEYWLDPVTQKFKMNKNFIVFGVGKRDCVGRSLAMRAIYANYALLMTKYRFKGVNDDPNTINIKQSWGFVMSVDPSIGIHLVRR